MPKPAPLITEGLPKLPVPETIEDYTWSFYGADTQYGTHGLHTYLAAMIPPLARRLIENYVPPEGSVLDPFCGGGAVLVEAVLTGRRATGGDINDLAVLISKAKTTYIERSQILEACQYVLQKAREYNGRALAFPKIALVGYWFKPYMLEPLTALRFAIDSMPESNVKDLFRVIFSATVRSVSLTHRNEIRLRRMTEKEQVRFNPDVLETFRRKAHDAAQRVSQLPKGAKAAVQKMDVRKMPFGRGQFDAIVCSPPYGDERNGVPYIQFAKNMLFWLGYTPQYIQQTKKHTLGWVKDGRKMAPPSPTLYQHLHQIRNKERACQEAIAFYHDYYDALNQMARVVRQRIIIVIAQRVLQNTIFNNAQITAELMAQIGIPLEAYFVRKLPTKRLPKMREFGAAMDREHILVFKK